MSSYTPTPDTITDADIQQLSLAMPGLLLGSAAPATTLSIGTLYTMYGILNQMQINAVAAGDTVAADNLGSLALRVRGHIQVNGIPSELGPVVLPTPTGTARSLSLATQVGGKAILNALPVETLALALNHSDDVLGVTLARMSFGILDMDIVGGYAVYTSDYDLIYTMNSSVGLTTQAWGDQALDVAWYISADFGDFAWLHYSTLAGTERILGLIRA